MLDWLSEEVASIKTNKLHVFKSLSRKAIRDFESTVGSELPDSYRQFLSTFGKATLYRDLDGYMVGVYPFTEVSDMGSDAPFFCFGYSKSGYAWFDGADFGTRREAPVFKLGTKNPRKIAPDFETWLEESCSRARRQYSKREWEGILRGPRPFSKRERQIVEARRLFEWKLIGYTKKGELRFIVTNNSDTTLPYLSIGIRHVRDEFIGAIRLDVSHIGPGRSGEVTQEAYDIAPAREQEPFEKPDPGPEDRERYWEFEEQ